MKKNYDTIESKLDGISWQLKQIAQQFERYNDILEAQQTQTTPVEHIHDSTRVRKFLND